jgi:hypothetical protein
MMSALTPANVVAFAVPETAKGERAAADRPVRRLVGQRALAMKLLGFHRLVKNTLRNLTTIALGDEP